MNRLLSAALALALTLVFTGCSPAAEPAATEPAAAEPAAKPTAAKPAAEPPAAEPAAASDFDRQMHTVAAPYLVIQDALAGDSTEGVAAAAGRIVDAAGKLEPGAVTGEHAGHYTDLPKTLASAAEAVRGAGDLAAARAAFKALSKPMGMWATMARPEGIDLVYCSMANGSWLQKTGPIRNPYHGSEMLACGEVISGPGKASR